MYGYCTNRVINMELIVKKPYTKYNKESGYETNDDCSETICHITRSGNCNKSGKGSIQAHRYIRLAIFDPCKDHTSYSCYCRCYGCCKENACKLISCLTCGTVKSIPSKPENKHTKCTKWKVMSRKGVNFCNLSGFVFCKLTDTRSKHCSTNDCGDTTNHMDCTGTGEIMESKLC